MTEARLDSSHAALASLPASLSPLLGREREMRTLGALLGRDGVRLLTLTGPGGVGKTRLALRLAAEAVPAFAEGVRFVDLASVRDPSLVASTIAQALDLHEVGTEPALSQLRAHLREIEILLVLDNFEQVAAAAPLLVDLLACCPLVKALVTSRVRLQVTGEQEYPVPPLELAAEDEHGGPEEVAQAAAARLFVARAQAVNPRFALTPENAAAVAAICRRLDGLPLAIELAAPRIKILPPAALLARLERRLSLLTGGGRDRPARQQTMRRAIAWSYDLLAPEAQTLFRRLAIFVGGFTLEAAEQIVGWAPVESPPEAASSDILDGLLVLADESLLVQNAEPGAEGQSEPRFGMLETIREYARERLAESSEEAAVRDAHAAWCLAFAEAADSMLSGHDQASGFQRLEVELANLRAALDYFRERGDAERGARLAIALSWFWSSRGYLREARAWFATFLAMPEAAMAAATRAKALLEAGNIAHWQGDWDEAAASLEQSRAAWQTMRHHRYVAIALRGLGSVALDRGDPERAAPLIEQCLPLLREFDTVWGVAFGVLLWGRVLCARGDPAEAMRQFEEAERLFHDVGDRAYVAVALAEQGSAALRIGDGVRGRTAYAESLALAEELDQPWWIAWGLSGGAELALAVGNPASAARLLAAAAALRETIGASSHARVLEADRRIAGAARAALGEERFSGEWVAGRALPMKTAIAEARATMVGAFPTAASCPVRA
ncbi:MAG TPA: tetratricopeptide repeat protein, partial [Thermomicrobiales bacterium]|nr:tetratricopeptide repeat protein [Thermomicrobiales bacterium]